MGVHHRMPVILGKEDLEKWLFSREEAVKLLGSHFGNLEKRMSLREYQQISLFSGNDGA